MTAPEDGLDKRLTAALRELAQQAPSFNTDASALGRPRELPVDTRHHSWTRPLAAAAMVAAVGGVAVVTWQNFSETGDKVGVDHGEYVLVIPVPIGTIARR